MRKILSLFFVMALCVIGLLAQGLVQRQSYSSTLNVLAKAKPQLRVNANSSFDDIQFWVGSDNKRVILIIEWYDGNRPDAMVWGYRRNGKATGHDMVVVMAKADPKPLSLVRYTGWMGCTIDDTEYGDDLGVRHDLDGAENEPKNASKFGPPITNPLLEQIGFPENLAEDVAAAIR